MKLHRKFAHAATLPLCVALLLTSVRLATGDEAGQKPDIAIQTDVMVPMRDQTRLATDLYLPVNARKRLAKFPADPDANAIRQIGQQSRRPVLCRPRLCVRRARHARPLRFRGRLAHAHRRRPRRLRRCHWIGQQPWSNGKLGTIGTSYVGGTQHALAMELPPQLVTVHPGRRHVEPGLRQHAQRRRLRTAVLELDLFDRWPQRAAGNAAIRPLPPCWVR